MSWFTNALNCLGVMLHSLSLFILTYYGKAAHLKRKEKQGH